MRKYSKFHSLTHLMYICLVRNVRNISKFYYFLINRFLKIIIPLFVIIWILSCVPLVNNSVMANECGYTVEKMEIQSPKQNSAPTINITYPEEGEAIGQKEELPAEGDIDFDTKAPLESKNQISVLSEDREQMMNKAGVDAEDWSRSEDTIYFRGVGEDEARALAAELGGRLVSAKEFEGKKFYAVVLEGRESFANIIEAKGLKPGEDREATPACVNTCPARALTFGDLDDPDSEVSRLIRDNGGFQLHPEYDTDPSIYFIDGRIGSSDTDDSEHPAQEPALTE